MRPFLPMLRLLLALGALTATWLLGCQWRSAAGPARVTAEEAKASVTQFLTDPDLPPGLAIKGDGVLAHSSDPIGPEDAKEYFDFPLRLAGEPGDAKVGSVWVDPASGMVTVFGLRGAPKGPPNASPVVSRAQALNIARRFCQRHCPAVWQQSDKTEESVATIPMGPDAWHCMFDGEKRGFTNYLSSSAEVQRGTGKVVIYHGDLHPSLEPPEIAVARAAAETTAREYAATHLGVPSGSLKVIRGPVDRWIVWSHTQPGFHAAHYIELGVVSHGDKTVTSGMTVSVDVVSGAVVEEMRTPAHLTR